MRKINIFLLLVILLGSPVLAQQTGTGYSSAVRLIDSGSPEEAMEQLRPYLDYNNYGKLALYAHYHFARAANKNQQYQLAKVTLEQLVTDYNWEKEDEALYLLGTTNFSLNQAYDGLKAMGKIDGEAIKEESYRASYDYCSNSVTVSLLVAHYASFKENKGYSLALKEKLLQQSVLSSNEKKLLAELNDMNLAGKEGDGRVLDRIKNNTLDVAIVLPFNYQGGSGVRSLDGGNFVFELYQGLDMAIKDAKSKGMDINVKTFDTERKNAVVQKILSDPFFNKADIIIGPIYPEETALVANFADRHKIPFINPLSNIKETFGDTDYAYLFRPSTEVIVDKLLNYGRKHVAGNRIAIAYSGSSRDELMARQLAEEASKRGYRIVFNEKVGASNIRDFLSNVGLKPGMTARADQIVIFSDDPYIASPTLSLLESLSTSVPIFVMDSWLYFNFANFEMLEGNDLNYIGNNTVDFSKSQTEDFRFRFFEKYSTYPGSNAYIGFELMKWVAGSVNATAGFDFRKNLNRQGAVQSDLGFGLDFNGSQSNRYVPVLKLNEGEIKEIK
ncbi:ABC transporter substrate-binding protein [Echinicola soli]|uniref:ABC transporter substrate-binding protein n=1 Tax=Echinicola soli TaxID=2591634 RepID=A0A514CDB8_9BACT|nr:ABC transporter substrate-binding protein [Echinicola soli]QDH77644.1 ABC transporter substrate-binding protein [Echinicola soli]